MPGEKFVPGAAITRLQEGNVLIQLAKLDPSLPLDPLVLSAETGVKLRALPASEAVVKLAEDQGADLIVMGTRGLTGIKHVLLGSVAERTLRHATCPVLTVKDADDETAESAG